VPYRWWVEQPTLLSEELDRAAALGLTIGRAEPRDDGFLVWHGVRVPGLDGPDQTFRVVFPVGYPHFRPGVFREHGHQMAHHDSPEGGLCLLPPSSAYWTPHDMVADLLCQQLPKTIGAGTTGDRDDLPDNIEVEQAEPAGAYLRCGAGRAFLHGHGIDATAGYGPLWFSVQVNPFEADSVRVDPTSAFFDVQLKHVLLQGTVPADAASGLRGRWSFVDVLDTDPQQAWRRAEDADSQKAPVVPVDVAGHQLKLSLRLVLFEEETSWRRSDPHRPGAAVLLRVTTPPRVTRTGRPARRKVASPRDLSTFHWIKVHRMKPEDRLARTPATVSLTGKRAFVCGYGAIGSVVVEHLARAGLGHFALLDSDCVEVGNLVRHNATLPMVGYPKVTVGEHLTQQINPQATVEKIPWQLGLARTPSSGETLLNEVDTVREQISRSHLVIDAAAEDGVARFLAHHARQFGKPYLRLTASEGAWGGRVLLLQPDGACWTCVRHHTADDLTLLPPRDTTNGTVQPQGCLLPTFTGSHFDLAEVSLQATRTAVSLLCADDPDGYRGIQPTLAVLRLREETGTPTPPTWSTHDLGIHPSCTGH
jgi:hypothetical protein